MGLPQEVVDRIMGTLQDDMNALKACSLTCKPMFASTRHLIHRSLRVSWENNQKILTPEEQERYVQGDRRELELRFVSFMGERDLLKYARHLNISIGYVRFSPCALEPHLQYFRSLDRIHTLTIRLFYAFAWCDVYNTYFTQFYPTLTTLSFHSPIGHHRFLLQFALQFPNLENLTLEFLRHGTLVLPGAPVPPVVTKSPPLRGHLQFAGAGLGPLDPVWTKEFAFDLPNGINFRSIEFRDVHCKHGQYILDGCAGFLEELAVHNVRNGGMKLLLRSFRAAKPERTGSLLEFLDSVARFQWSKTPSGYNPTG